MGEIRFVGIGEKGGYPYLVCKKRIVGPGKTRGYPYPVCKNIWYYKTAVERMLSGDAFRSNLRKRLAKY